MQKIGAWIRNPKHNWIKGQDKHCALFELFCENPGACDLLTNENTCLHCGAMSPCRFGRKASTEGPTTAARSFYSTMEKWRKQNEGHLDRLKSLRAYNRVFKANGHFYLPYSFMTKDWMGPDDAPLESKWVSDADLTTELLGRICQAKPRALFGGVITDYQNKEVPKFISDLKAFYPEVFDRLPQDQKARIASINYVGRTADITTCAPGEYIFSKNKWQWDGSVLRGRSMLLPPVKGDLEITIKPIAGEAVTISDNTQVTATTRFLD